MKHLLPESIITSIKANISFISMVKGYGITPIRKGKSWFAVCPFHTKENQSDSTADTTTSLVIDADNNQYHCLICKAHGDVIEFVQQMEHLDFQAAADRLLRLVPVVKQSPASLLTTLPRSSAYTYRIRATRTKECNP